MNAPDVELKPPEGLELPIEGGPYKRPDAALLKDLEIVSSATAGAMLHRMGIRQTFIQGPTARTPGAKVVGSALTHLFPWACNVPVAVAGVLVMPGDIIIADDDGATVVPQQMAAVVAAATREHEDWETFSRMRLAEGGSLYKYYPLNDEGRQEYTRSGARTTPGSYGRSSVFMDSSIFSFGLQTRD